MPVFGLNRCNIDIGGQQLTGFGESDAIAWKRVKDRVEEVDCCDGETVTNMILCNRGEITITARYDSPINHVLITRARAGSEFSFTCEFPNGDVIESPACHVLKDPEPSAGAKTSDYVWVLSAKPLRTSYNLGV